MRYVVLLTNETVGVIGDDVLDGQLIESFLNKKITVLTRTRTGLPKRVTGRMADVLNKQENQN